MKLLSILSIGVATVAAVPNAPVLPRASNSSNATPNFGYAKLYRLQEAFYEKFMYPNNAKEAASINSTAFSEDVLGRVSDTRDFVGRELNTEYIFGLFIPTDSISIIGQPYSYEIMQFTANQNIASASTRVNFTFPSFGNISLPVTIDTWITWNEAEEITQYDVTFRWFAYLLQTLLLGLAPGNSTLAMERATMALASSVCNAHTSYCNGTNAQYESRDDCMQFLTQEIRFGQAFELGMNTLGCRSIHEIMLKYRPDVHCPHIGKSGGGMCDDTMGYVEKVTENFFKNSPWVPTMQ
ncbi:uncharacterized protein BDR25DRAFT_337065 [Lindgomyces ingoldianus]|uniref:Uncharacterized protein n=1 Tax=Lindgomyces ingoldianus TaxID=673940 RepID=A0ACB6QGP1_9PLEO|nr:uncharacterized protein BDR25DRAFT_337065 [Lindgomyces ingoldianus]KAF2465320.1 hypothetical protein BDR25DRAFT_337065 [Lindgomyces ingoldianus]